jgi:hypothetical protein
MTADRWHLWGNPGCVHENDDERQIVWNQSDGASCDCVEFALAEGDDE